jgi:hypothetical protein
MVGASCSPSEPEGAVYAAAGPEVLRLPVPDDFTLVSVGGIQHGATMYRLASATHGEYEVCVAATPEGSTSCFDAEPRDPQFSYVRDLGMVPLRQDSDLFAAIRGPADGATGELESLEQALRLGD